MKSIFKYSLLLLLLFFFSEILPFHKENKNKVFNPSDSASYLKKRNYFQKEVQRYWYISTDTAIILADSAISLASQNQNKQDIAYFTLLKGVAYYFQGNSVKAIQNMLFTLREGQGLLTDKLIANTQNMLSLCYRNLAKYDSSIYYGKMALQWRIEKVKDSNDIAGSLDNLSTIFTNFGEYDSAIYYSVEAAKIFDKTGNKKEEAYVWVNLSNLYASVGDKKNSYFFLKKAQKAMKEIGEKIAYVDTYDNLGHYFLDNGELDSAMISFKKATALYQKLERYDDYADTKRSMGDIYLRLDSLSKAEKALNQAYQQFKNSGRALNLIETQILLAELELRRSNYIKAKSYLDSAWALENKVHADKTKLKILKKREKLMEQWGKPLIALQLFHHIDSIKDRLNKKELNSKLEELSLKYHTEKILSENKKLKQQHLISQMHERQMRLYAIVMTLGIILLLIILLLLHQKRKHDILLKEQKIKLIEKEDALIKSELEKAELKKQELTNENNFRAKQLTTYTLHMMQKNLILQDVLKEIKEMENQDSRHIKKRLVDLKIQIINALSSDSDWENFKIFFEKVNANFFSRLKEKYPDLTKTDEKLCALIRLNMNINEAASVLNVNYNSIRIARYRLRKKMNLKPEEDLYEVIRNI